MARGRQNRIRDQSDAQVKNDLTCGEKIYSE